MNYLLVFCLSVFSLTSFATDNVLGSVVAIEREVLNVSEACAKTTKESETIKGNFSCHVRYLQPPEFSLKQGSLFFEEGKECRVSIDNLKGALLITFRSMKSKQFSAANECLQAGLNKKGIIKVPMYTVQ